jgi:hypothetical protein
MDMVKSLAICLCLSFLSLNALSQSKSHNNGNGKAQATSSGCGAAANSGDNSKITIHCNGIGEAQGKRLLEVLNLLLIDRASLDSKLDRLFVELVPHPPKVTIVRQESFAAKIPMAVAPDGTPLESAIELQNPGVVVVFQIEGDFIAPQFRVVCNQPCTTVAAGGYSGGYVTYPPRSRHPFAEQPNIVDVLLDQQLRSGDFAHIGLRSTNGQSLDALGVGAILPETR